jgi:alpha-ketoglutarate-dependent taurine dioxygenase
MQPSHQYSASSEIMNQVLGKSDVLSHNWNSGDLVVLDNHRVLHGRGIASTPDPDRKLARILIA